MVDDSPSPAARDLTAVPELQEQPRREKPWRGFVIWGAVSLVIGAGMLSGGVAGYDAQSAINRANEAACAANPQDPFGLGCSLGAIGDGLSLEPYLGLLTIGATLIVNGVVLTAVGAHQRRAPR